MVDVVHQRGSVADLHALDPFAACTGEAPIEPQVWWCDATDSALVLGSRQAPELIDTAALAAAGLNMTRRRSGGGAVIVRPDSCIWIDVVLPHGVAPDDIRGAMVWIGEHWLAALLPSLTFDGGRSDAEVHRGGMLDSAWSNLVCFAGIGPGEVMLGGRKLVGLSQRRTRRGLRLQGLAYSAPSMSEFLDLFVGEIPDVELAEPAALAGLDPERLAHTLAARLTT